MAMKTIFAKKRFKV